MQAFIDTVAKIRQTIKAHRLALSKNETMTRYALIDPLPGKLGWDLSSPDDVVLEDNTGVMTAFNPGRPRLPRRALRPGCPL